MEIYLHGGEVTDRKYYMLWVEYELRWEMVDGLHGGPHGGDVVACGGNELL